MAGLSTIKSGASIVCAVAIRPQLWSVAITQLFRLAPRSWWRRSPFLPIPTRQYLKFRAQTQYGGDLHKIEVDDVLSYLNWLRDFR